MRNHILDVTKEAESVLWARRSQRFGPGGERLCLKNQGLT